MSKNALRWAGLFEAHTHTTPKGARRAFSLIELFVVMGIIFILVGLLMPSLAGSVSQAQLARDSQLVRQNTMVVLQYATDYDDVFPLWGEYDNPFIAIEGWPKPLIQDGYFDSIKQVDPKINEAETNFRVMMTMAAIYDWKLMRPGKTIPHDDAVWSAVHTYEVLFPSSKGLVLIANNGIDINDPHAKYFCCIEPWVTPVCMVDGSVVTGTYLDFNGGQPLWEENDIGTPVFTTWYGMHGVDRP